MISSEDSLEKFFVPTLILKRIFNVSDIRERCHLSKFMFAIAHPQIFADPDVEKRI